jgi:hypothetical protein
MQLHASRTDARLDEARQAFEHAASLATNDRQRERLLARAAACASRRRRSHCSSGCCTVRIHGSLLNPSPAGPG